MKLFHAVVMLCAVTVCFGMAGQAEAIELFTNFDNGQNIGFPSNDVPVRIYGGVGTPGWNTHALQNTPMQSGTPAMFPTGANPHLYQPVAPPPGWTNNPHGYGNKYYGQRYQGRIYSGRWGKNRAIYGGPKVFEGPTTVEGPAISGPTKAEEVPAGPAIDSKPTPTTPPAQTTRRPLFNRPLMAAPGTAPTSASPTESEPTVAPAWPQAEGLFPSS